MTIVKPCMKIYKFCTPCSFDFSGIFVRVTLRCIWLHNRLNLKIKGKITLVQPHSVTYTPTLCFLLPSITMPILVSFLLFSAFNVPISSTVFFVYLTCLPVWSSHQASEEDLTKIETLGLYKVPIVNFQNMVSVLRGLN